MNSLTNKKKSSQNNFEKLSTSYSKGDLAKIAKDKRKQGKLSDKDKTALEQYIVTEEFHKKMNAEIIPKLDNSSAAAVEMFKVFFPSPPVPQVSITSSDTFTEVALFLKTYTPPAISFEVSPFLDENVKKS